MSSHDDGKVEEDICPCLLGVGGILMWKSRPRLNSRRLSVSRYLFPHAPTSYFPSPLPLF